MSSLESFDGLCGWIAPWARSDLQLRCVYDITHQGPHSWAKLKKHFVVSGCTCRYRSDEEIAEQGFLNSVYASNEQTKEDKK